MGFLDALSKPAKPMLGLDISSSAVKLIELSQSADRYKVESYRVMPLPANTVVEKNIADIQALADTLERLVARSGTKLTDTAVAVSGSSVITKEIELPAGLSDLQMETQIEVEADQYIPYLMEEVSFDFDVIGPVDNNPDLVRVLLAACRQENVEHRREALEMAGLIPKVVDVEGFAIERAYRLMMEQFDQVGDQVVAIADIGATMLTFTVLLDGKTIYNREQLFGGRQLTEEIQRRYGLSWEEAGEAKRKGGLPEDYRSEVMEPFTESLIQHINRSLQFFYSSSNYNYIDQLLLAGGVSAIEGLVSQVEEAVNLPTSIANTVANMEVSSSINRASLDKVPWDQALEIVLKAKGLDKRQEGNVLMVAPAAEIAEQERLQVEANKQLQELAPLETAFVRIKYADAAEIFELFTADEDQQGYSGGSAGGREGNATTSILSQRGSAIVDERTNTIILTDTEEKINEFRRLITEIDVPIKQVLIEARIVIANTDFKKELGVTWGLAGIDKLSGGQFSSATGDRSLGFSGRRSGLTPGAGVVETFTYQADEVDTAGPDGQVGTPDDTVVVTQNYDFGLGDSLAVDLGVSDPTGSFSLGYLTDSFLIDLELSALESDGYGEIVSQPKVLTGDKQQAVIKSGTEIAFQKATYSGATSVEFKEAALQLEVTPQITPDNRIIMDLLVSQDSVGAFTPTGEPSIDITQIETQALVGDGQTLVLGGIFQTEEVNGTEKVPMLGDIPFLGKLFRNDLRNIEKREILIFITPKIIDDNLLDR